jgi:SAM-dependent methyltransferase
MTEFHDLSSGYINTEEWHGETVDRFYEKVQDAEWLKAHRDWVEANQWGMGDRPFHWMWKIIVDTLPDTFGFLEIGCYRGQVLSLIGLLAKTSGKKAAICGVSPFVGTRDAINAYDNLDYLADIKRIFEVFNAGCEMFIPIRGMSQDRDIIDKANDYAPFDVVYIDGSHEYDAVRLDIENYAPMVKKGGLLVMDDASCLLRLPPFSNDKGYNRCWPGIPTVSEAVRDHLETRGDFVHRLAIGHNRVFEKVGCG